MLRIYCSYPELITDRPVKIKHLDSKQQSGLNAPKHPTRTDQISKYQQSVRGLRAVSEQDFTPATQSLQISFCSLVRFVSGVKVAIALGECENETRLGEGVSVHFLTISGAVHL